MSQLDRIDLGTGSAHPALHGRSPARSHRVEADGHHLRLGRQTFRVKGVTYGSFLPRLDGAPFPERLQVKLDFQAMAELGLNVVRTYAVPSPDVLELAEEHGLRLLVGLEYDDWRMEDHPGRRANRRVRDAGLRAAELALASCHAHPSVLGISVGNEVPGDLVRVHGIRAVERVLSHLVVAVHEDDPGMLVTYSNYPTTEYLEVDELDFMSFNVFLERPNQLEPYLRHLQVVAGDRPLLVSEMGLASLIHGLDAQSRSLEWQLRLVDEVGGAGATVFSWTDEWGVGGEPVDGWGFGITTDTRMPKPATQVVSEWTRREIVDLRERWPRVSVVVCAYNEARVIEECLESLEACEYPALEVIVCDDGSTDSTLSIARRFPFQILELVHGGLSRARNAGIAAATGDIVAFLDADAACHPEWPFHLVLSMEDDDVVATGGPNLPFPEADLVERAVARSPGAPTEVLSADDRAEHVPGCNMAFKRDALLAVGCFDPVYTSAGDDVDVCWKLLDRGWKIAFSPAAQVRHHRRSTVRGYLRQQRGYGRAERLVAARHRHRFNRLGQARWGGFIYGGQRLFPGILRPIVYHGYQGQASFQTVSSQRSVTATAWATAILPFWVPVAVAGLLVSPWWIWGAVVAGAVVGLTAAFGLAISLSSRGVRGESHSVATRLLIGVLHVAQPLARAWGRLRAPRGRSVPTASAWTGERERWLADLARVLRARGAVVSIGGPTDAWDLEVAAGPLLRARVVTGVAWRWVSQHRVFWRPSRWLTVVAVGVSTVAVRGSGQAAVVLAATAGIILLTEAIVLRRRLTEALCLTTEQGVSK